MTRSFLRHTATCKSHWRPQVPDHTRPNFECLVRSPLVTSVLRRLSLWLALLAPDPGWQMGVSLSGWLSWFVIIVGKHAEQKWGREPRQGRAGGHAKGVREERSPHCTPVGSWKKFPSADTVPLGCPCSHLPLGTSLQIRRHCLQASRPSLLQALSALGVFRWAQSWILCPRKEMEAAEELP